MPEPLPSRPVRARAVGLAASGYGLLFLAAVAQTLAGRLPWDLAPGMLAAIVLVALPFAQALLARRSTTPALARQGA